MPRSVVQEKHKAPVQKVQANRFKVLALDSDSDGEVEQEEQHPVQKQLVAETQDNVYMSKRKNKNRMEKVDREGWTSITWTKPQFVSEDDEERQIQKEIMEEIAEAEACEEEQEKVEEKNDTASAMMWAERIRASLEKAEQSKRSVSSGLSDDFVASLGKLSFFRRPLTQEA